MSNKTFVRINKGNAVNHSKIFYVEKWGKVYPDVLFFSMPPETRFQKTGLLTFDLDGESSAGDQENGLQKVKRKFIT